MAEGSNPTPTTWTYTERDVSLYALSLGCTREETRYVYENDSSFCALPTFGVLCLHNGALASVDVSKLVPNFNPMLLLHGEQYMEQHRPFPAAGSVKTAVEVLDVLDKGKAAVVVLRLTTRDAASGEIIATNETTTFIRGSGGFGKSSPKHRTPESVAENKIPERQPDAVVEEQTAPNQAALYRLNGDDNPLHIDPEFAGVGGFPQPILHGLCTFGIAAKHVLKAFGAGDPAAVKTVKARFAKHVFPGETLRTEMWQVSATKIVFQVLVKDRKAVAISNAAVVFKEKSKL